MYPTRSSRRTWFTLSVLASIWLFVGVAIWQRTAVFDWWRLRGYQPAAPVVQLADDTSMKDGARHLFYVYHPALESRDAFNGHCRDGEYTIVLGCYVSKHGIYLFDVEDARLNGVKEVTAAHETLHAAYERLSPKERTQVDAWTNEAFQNLDNQRIKNNIEQYRKNDPSSVPNELHSILGTEVRTLPAPLENYYKRYFVSRLKIVDYSDMYETAFNARKAQADGYEAQLKSLQTQIEQANQNLKAENTALQQEYTQLEASRDSVDPASFNARAAAYNNKVKAYNQSVATTRELINRYNSIYASYKQVVLEQQNLYKAIDSRPQTLQTH